MSFNDLSRHDGMPPGTVLLEDLQTSADKIILHPKPSRDPNDPLNWSRSRKYINYSLVSFYTLLVYALVNVQTVTWGVLNTELGFSYEILNDSYAAATAALMVGGLTLIPFALKFGRRFLYFFSLAVQFGMAIWYARTYTVGDLMGTNVISCFVGALSEIMVQMTVADMFFVHERGLLNTIYIWIATSGSTLAPIAGGYITDNINWRWVWWFQAIFIGILTVIFFFFYEETLYTRAQVTLDGEVVQTETAKGDYSKDQKSVVDTEKHAADLPPQSPMDHEQTELDIDHSIPLKSYSEKLKLWVNAPGSFLYYLRHTYQCFLVMWYCPAVFYMALLNGAANTAQIILITVYSAYLYEAPYNMSESDVGLFSLSGFIGVLIGSLCIGPLTDRSIVWLSKRNGGIYEPEMRLWLVLWSTPLFLLSILLFGLGLAHNMSWVGLAFGYGILCAAITPATSLSLTYLTDAYTEIISDCLVALNFVKFGFATIMVFALTPWINLDGIQNMFIIIAVMFTVIYLGCYVIILYGKRLRVRSAPMYFKFADRQVMRF